MKFTASSCQDVKIQKLPGRLKRLLQCTFTVIRLPYEYFSVFRHVVFSDNSFLQLPVHFCHNFIGKPLVNFSGLCAKQILARLTMDLVNSVVYI